MSETVKILTKFLNLKPKPVLFANSPAFKLTTEKGAFKLWKDELNHCWVIEYPNTMIVDTSTFSNALDYIEEYEN